MFRLRNQPAHRRFDIRGLYPGQFLPRPALHPFRKGRPASDGRRAASDFIANLYNPAIPEQGGQAQNIAADRIRHLDRDGRRREIPHIARIFEMI